MVISVQSFQVRLDKWVFQYALNFKTAKYHSVYCLSFVPQGSFSRIRG